ncbi:speckle-type POZ protein B-like [Cotesia glomerata]|uniref:speckle-type POZ protein B-like n=1 Tax=Cotesia glomerata TaxID=32391 RepID=UPI001D03055D|nr:speckle-type POZ protein B-like [Cotesia glomerata]
MVLIKQFDVTPTNPFVNSYQNLIEKKKLLNNRDEFLLYDTLTIGIKLVVQFDVPASDIKFLPSLMKRCIGDDLKELLKNMTECDVTLIVKNEEFQAHKAILMTRSPVFTAMFSHEMKEKKENQVTIPNVDPVIFKRILEFIYTDKVENLKVYAERLLEVADQYQLSYLKELCEESIEKSITVENVFKIMTLADHVNSEQLLDRCMYVAAADINSIINTKGYKEAISSPQSTRILSKLVEKLAFIIADNKSDDLTTNVIKNKMRPSWHRQ